MEPSAAIAVIENDLRRLIGAVLGGHRDWLERALGEEAVVQLDARRVEEARRRRPAVVPSDLLAYTHLYQLRKIINKNWQSFSTALGEKKEFDVLMDKVEDFRNAPAHSRELLPHERLLLEGIAGIVRTQVTKFVSTQSADAKHYPIIELVSDSFGNVAQGGGEFAEIADTGLTLQVGDVVRFKCRGWDPQGRLLTWRFDARGARHVESVEGTEVEFEWVVQPRHVGVLAYLQIDLASSGQYHRHRWYDDRVNFLYSVDPPVE